MRVKLNDSVLTTVQLEWLAWIAPIVHCFATVQICRAVKLATLATVAVCLG